MQQCCKKKLFFCDSEPNLLLLILCEFTQKMLTKFVFSSFFQAAEFGTSKKSFTDIMQPIF